MAQFREAIELLAKILRENGASKIKAETVRQAKFNKNEATPALWRLLFELIYYSQYQCIDNTAIKAVTELSSEELVVFVKREMQDRGFVSRELMVLPSDMGYGSRELLLAIGWLMCKEHVMDAFMMNCTSPLEEDIITWAQTEEEEEGQQLTTPRDPAQRVQQLLWLNNKLRLNLRSLHALQRQKETLEHKVHEATQGVSLTPDKNHLSVMEVYLLRHPDLLKKNLLLLERDNERLQNLLKWKNHEDVFWKWMESVLDGKLQELAAAGEQEETSSIASAEPSRQQTGSKAPQPRDTDTPTSSVLRLAETHLDLREAIIKYEAIVDYLERLWAQKSEDLSEAEIDSVLASINLELSIQRASIALNNTENYVMEQPKPPGPTEWNLTPPDPPKRLPHHSLAAKQASVDQDDSGSDTWRDIEEEIVSLQKTVRQLEEDISGQQQNYMKHLKGLAENLVDNVVIPPMSAVMV